MKNTKKQLLFRILSILVLACLLYSALFTIDETQVGVVTRFGKPLENIRTPGLNIKLPWPIDEVIKIDRRLLLLDLSNQSWLTYDQIEVSVNPFLVWRITDPILFASTVQTKEVAETRITDVVLARLGILVGQLPFNAFISLEASEIEVHKTLEETTKIANEVVNKFGLIIDDIGMETFLVPAQNRISIIQRMNAERQRVSTKYRSMGIEEALTIQAQAAAEKEKILGRAQAESTAIRGKGEAEALRILAQAYDKDPKFFRFIRSLESYEAIIGKQSTVFLEADSPLLRYFNGTGIKAIQNES